MIKRVDYDFMNYLTHIYEIRIKYTIFDALIDTIHLFEFFQLISFLSFDYIRKQKVII